MEEEYSARMPNVVLWKLPACSFRQQRNLDVQVCAPSGVALRFYVSWKRTECPLGAQAAGLCSVPLAEKLLGKSIV